jgi:hypothetical protein
MKLTVSGARLVIVFFSLAITGILLCLFVLSPLLGIPFNPGRNEHFRLVEIVLPVFLGYLGNASHFIFRSHRMVEPQVLDERILAMLVYGPFIIYIFFNTSLFLSFYLCNQPDGSGMPIDELTRWFSIALGVLTGTISIINSYVFNASTDKKYNQKT